MRRMRTLPASVLAPLVLIGLLGGVIGFTVAQQITPRIDSRDAVRVSAIAMPATPSPKPSKSPTPEPSAAARPRDRAGNRDDGGSDGGPACPAGCTCESRPPSGIVIVCR